MGGLIRRVGLCLDEHILKVGLYLGELISGWTYNQVCYTCTWVGLCQGGLIIRCVIHVLGWAYTQGGLILRDGLILSMGLFSGELILRVVLYLGWHILRVGLYTVGLLRVGLHSGVGTSL